VSRPRFGTVKLRDRGWLPHWEKEGAAYFVTFRLADSLPKAVLDRIESEKQAIVKTAQQLHRPLSADELRKVNRLSGPAIEQFLDNGSGACYLKQSSISGAVANALCHFAAKRYRLFAWCVMPNHVHVVFKVFPGHKLSEIVHSWKSFTAKQANQILGIQGAFWQGEYYDHLIRDQSGLERSIRYVARNPEKANLKRWEWVWVCGQDARKTAAGTAALRNATDKAS
jgi:REP element-mobilizing transposase RayT